MPCIFLYRGISKQKFQADGETIIPKIIDSEFLYTFHCGEGIYCGTGVGCGESRNNAVIRHQLNQEGYPTSGISTTPHFERAVLYATHNHTCEGFVFKIDYEKLNSMGIEAFHVNEKTSNPSVPEDDEIILLVCQGGGPLPHEVIEEKLEVK
ncbi:MAG: hypothetical protein CVV64_11940 [Candidatus Wallbacteria bacterium HGW-Wallbacteria-1]|jgi:hypothetical protein|uniref:Uncharacterized protein n=1 Tax=Candidatus Wallbacteria bacterium HGW-Wallbacteria-1 TaxID=2013854 RepID=A0A2N1PNV1_9BACT|nr:MAG: hypothetical protein CVV64_11940 [Candidatus Wallbacteria bacterium HGW-Wallbacteria-1]